MQIIPGIADAVSAAQTSRPAPIKMYGIVFRFDIMLFSCAPCTVYYVSLMVYKGFGAHKSHAPAMMFFSQKFLSAFTLPRIQSAHNPAAPT